MLNPPPPEDLSLLLEQSVPALESLMTDLGPATWRYRPAVGEWSITEIVCHLRDVDREVHIPRLQTMNAEEEPFLPGVVADDWAIERNYQAQDGPTALRELVEARRELLKLLPPPGDTTWQRRGRHTFFGPTSFLELVCLVLEHDQLHIEQARETLQASRSA